MSVKDQRWDLIVTMDDATSEHYDMRFVEEEGTASSFAGVQTVIEAQGLFCARYTDRGSPYWTTREAGGRVDKVNVTQFGRALKQLNIEMIPAYSPEAEAALNALLARTRDGCPRSLLFTRSPLCTLLTVI